MCARVFVCVARAGERARECECAWKGLVYGRDERGVVVLPFPEDETRGALGEGTRGVGGNIIYMRGKETKEDERGGMIPLAGKQGCV